MQGLVCNLLLESCCSIFFRPQKSHKLDGKYALREVEALQMLSLSIELDSHVVRYDQNGQVRLDQVMSCPEFWEKDVEFMHRYYEAESQEEKDRIDEEKARHDEQVAQTVWKREKIEGIV